MSTLALSTFRFVGLIILMSCFWSSAAAQTESVTIYNSRDAVGSGQDIPAGVYQVNGKQFAPGEGGQINVSIKVPQGYFIRFCAEKDGTGKCDEFGEGIHNLTSVDFNFIRVWKGEATKPPVPAAATTQTQPPAASGGAVAPLTVFERKAWLGLSQVYRPGMYRSSRGEFGRINDNQVRSVIIQKGFRARFCADEGLNARGSGDCESYEEGKHNLRFANSISFIEVVDLSDRSPEDEKMPVVLYELSSQMGKMQGFDVGTYRASIGQFRKLADDDVLSIHVHDGYRASVCADEPVSGDEGGNCEEFGPGRRNLKNRRAASYLRVWKDSK